MAGGDWERYDQKFREAMAVLPRQLKWQRRQYDLWDDCMRRRSEHKKTAPVNKTNNPNKFFPTRPGFCYAFQRFGKCER